MNTLARFLIANRFAIISLLIGLILGYTLNQGSIQGVIEFLVKCLLSASSFVSQNLALLYERSDFAYALLPLLGMPGRLTKRQKELNQYRIERSMLNGFFQAKYGSFFPTCKPSIAKTVDKAVIAELPRMYEEGTSWPDAAIVLFRIIEVLLAKYLFKTDAKLFASLKSTCMVDAVMLPKRSHGRGRGEAKSA